MKQSWKLGGALPDVAAAMRESKSLRSAAKKLGVNVSTVSRLVKAVRIPDPNRRAKVAQRRPVPPTSGDRPGEHETFTEWVHATFVVSRGESELARLGQHALDVANDPAQSATIRLQASATFRMIWRELSLPSDDLAASEGATAVRPFARHAG